MLPLPLNNLISCYTTHIIKHVDAGQCRTIRYSIRNVMYSLIYKTPIYGRRQKHELERIHHTWSYEV